MNRKTVFRNLAIVAGILLVIYLVSYFSNDTRGWKNVDTSVALTQLADKQNVKQVQIDDKEQQLRITLKQGNDATGGQTQIMAKYPGGSTNSSTWVNQLSCLTAVLNGAPDCCSCCRW